MASRRILLAGGLASALAAPAVRAQGSATADWPNRPIRLVVPFAPGGQSDTVARLLQPLVSERLGQTLVIENRTGAGGAIGAGLVAQAPADGYTLMFDAASFLIVPFAVRGLSFDYATAFTPVGMVAEQPYVLAVTQDFPARDVAGFVAAAKAGREISYGSPGVGSVGHLAGALLASRAGIRLEHVPYRGGADAARDLAAGTLQAGIMSTNSLDPLFQGGRARPLALTSGQRRGGPPGVPTLAESGYPGFDMTSWNAVFARTGTPAPIIARVAEALNHATTDAGVQAALRRIGSEAQPADPAAFAARLDRERGTIRTIIAETGITFG
ncbi:tripartite tricarboxylate transporter substrate binding protein [Roseomonas sp. OT10]|uniref:Bug family tripartite tricarboxylate transporter substrate binding protein n=1 Tax=Roseomonas cutis TaxID=2897332 RepID=UPI001E41EE91|nr:tripartite tricarboxylate transporter substrate binding protein [Roseomonas sp. OT10]UFN47844.1 tripartite tricarboxylate transporter substrate binding protein [Roseomonas sp. OT10]